MDACIAQVVVVVTPRPTVSPSPGELNFVPHIWVKVTEDFKQKKMESGKGWWVVGVGWMSRVNPHTFTHADGGRGGGGSLLRVPVIGLGEASGGYLMWRLLSETWI